MTVVVPEGVAAGPADTGPLRLVPIPAAEHAAWAAAHGGVSFLQCPSWGRVKEGWRSESLAWTGAEGRTVGAALVLYREVPGLGRSFAYLPEGPVIDWAAPDLGRWLAPLAAALRSRGVFTVRIGPPPALRVWEAGTIRAAVRGGAVRQLRDVLPDAVDPVGAMAAERLRALGWEPAARDTQPRYTFRLPLAGRELGSVRDGLSAEWRRNLRRARGAGVEVVEGSAEDLESFYALLRETERRAGFDLGRGLAYYRRQFAELNAERPGRMRLFLARHRGEVLAAHTFVTVGRGTWYLTGGSASAGREVRPSNALQWAMIQAAHGLGADEYDLRGVRPSWDPAGRDYGLLRWKLGTGGRVVEGSGEWELALNRPLHLAFRRYLARRQG
ncbi:lipid II:glycine glycyltransferase FemX [Kitasatospora sp. NPDC091207]|uniref:lipid II:glycine glycyltransferase FemX n=1 Tax=Kitasatospora sp. NPDC091207 TaxID=3364083 RepID=UPI00380E4495